MNIKIKSFSSFHVHIHKVYVRRCLHLYAKDGAVRCSGHVSRDQDRVHLGYTNDVRLNMEIFSIIKTLHIIDSTDLIYIYIIYTCF